MRTKEKKEVDFCLAEDDTPVQLIEVKYADKNISSDLRSFSRKYSIPGTQLVKEHVNEYRNGLIEVRKADVYLKTLREYTGFSLALMMKKTLCSCISVLEIPRIFLLKGLRRLRLLLMQS